MSETRVLTYASTSKALETTATDDAGNFCIDKEGNVIIPIHTFYIRIDVNQPRYDGATITRTTLTIELPNGKTYHTYTTPDDYTGVVKRELYSVCSVPGEDGLYIYFNSRDMIARFGKAFTIGVSLDKEFKPPKFVFEGKKCYDIYESYGMLRIGWTSTDVLHADTIPPCSLKPYSSGTFAVDLNEMTISTDDSSDYLSYMPKLCDKICTEEPDTITVVCDRVFCAPSSGHVYIQENRADGNYIWAKAETEVEIESGETQEEAIAGAAAHTITTDEKRMYIVASESRLRYWRDVEHDQNVNGAKYVGSVYYTPAWDTLEWGFLGSFVPISIERHGSICGVKLYFTPDEGDYPGSVFSGTILTETFDSDSIPADATPEEALDLFLTWQLGSLMLIPKYYDTDGEVIASSDAADIGKYEAYGALRRGTRKTYYAWTLSPCYIEQPQTVFTETAPVIENGSVSGSILGDSYGEITDEVFTPIGTVTTEGYATYSVTSEDDTTYHWKEDLAVDDSTTDEEFE